MKKNERLIGVLDYLTHNSHRYYTRLAAEYCAREQHYDLIAVHTPKLLPSLPLAGILYRGMDESCEHPDTYSGVDRTYNTPGRARLHGLRHERLFAETHRSTGFNFQSTRVLPEKKQAS